MRYKVAHIYKLSYSLENRNRNNEIKIENTMDELQDEIRRLRAEIQSLRSEIDEIKGDNAENNNLLKRVLSLLNSRS